MVLQRSGFRLVRSEKHETWEKTLPSGEIIQVRLSHQMGRDVPTPLFHAMLRQARLSQAEFFALLRKVEVPYQESLGHTLNLTDSRSWLIANEEREVA